MPEQPSGKREPLNAAPVVRLPGPPYVELHCKTNFSFLEGASHPDELVLQAASLGYAALAVADRNSLAGVVRAHAAAKQAGLKLLVGAEITPADAPAAVLIATDRAAYGRLSRLITLGCRQAPKGECRLTFADVAAHAEGLLAGVVGSQASEAELAAFREAFGDRGYCFASLHYGPDDERELERRKNLAQRAGLPLVATGNVSFHNPSRRPLCDTLTAIRHGLTVAECMASENGNLLFPNAERYLKTPQQMWDLFAAAPEAVERTIEIANRATFSLDELRYEYPEELAPPGETPLEYLTRLAWQGARERYPDGVPDKVRRLIEHELALIAELHYEAYFLTVHDLVAFARSKNILCQGRGSAANSAVCYCLKITAVNPNEMEMLFERFISRERKEAPDIDVDFEHERREEVIQYLYDKYGRERAGMTAEVITYRPRSAVRDVGKALGLSLDRIDKLAKVLEHHSLEQLEPSCRMAGIDPASRIGRQLVTLTGQLVGFPRHLGQHVGGMVMTRGPLSELVPIENASMPDRTVIEWDKNDLDELGMLKVDCLALGMLTAIHRSFDLIEQHAGRRLTLATIPVDDPPVYEMIRRADTLGVFQIESRAQMSMLPRLKPERFYDLVIEIAIVRPGPIQGNMVHPYLRRRAGEEEVVYPSDAIRAVLEKTLGVPLFQEQAMRLAMVAGFSASEADQLRRAVSGWRSSELVSRFKTKLVDGLKKTGLPQEFAERVFQQIEGFGEYGFPESHSVSFALLAYASAWLKCHYPAFFAAALLNCQPMGFYAPAQIVRDAIEHQVEVRPADVNHSRWDCTLESADSAFALRLGLRMIGGLPQAQAQAIERARASGEFRSVQDFARRGGLSQATIARLAAADAFGSLALDRRSSLWQTLGEEKCKRPQPLFAELDDDEPPVALPAMSPQEEVFADYQTAGLSLKAHPISFFRSQLDRLGVVPAERLVELSHGEPVRVAGLVLVRQRPGTARGVTFVTLEDETGIINLIVRLDVWKRHYQVARTASAYLAHGRLQKQHDVIHVLVSKLENMAGAVNEMRSQSRDFR